MQAAARYPTDYDFRYCWISSLLSPRDNPDGCAIFGLGLATVAVLMFSVPIYLLCRADAPWLVRIPAFSALLAGFVGVLLLGLEPVYFPSTEGSRPIHKIATNLAIGGGGGGFSGFALFAVLRSLVNRTRVWPLAVTTGVLLIPALGAGLVHATKAIAELGWAVPEQLASQVPFLMSMAFWEWLAVCSLLAACYMAVWHRARELSHAPSTY